MGTWTTNSNLPAAIILAAQGPCVYDGKIYIVGGSVAANTVYEYDAGADDYTPLATLQTGRKYAAIGIHGSTIYVAGGHGGAGSLNTVEKYDITAPASGWSYVDVIPDVNLVAAGAIYGDYFYTFGGTTDVVYKYDINGDSWSTVDTSSGIGTGSAVEVVGDYIWVIGGGGNRKAVRKWDPANDTWVTGSYTAPTNDVYYSTAGVRGTKIYIAGGEGGDTGSPIAKFVSYDTSTDTWDDTLPDMPTARQGTTGDVVDDSFYVIGGHDGPAVSNKNESYYIPPPPNPGGDINWAHTKIKG